MFNIILALSAGIIIGWSFNSFFQALNVPTIIRNDINLTQNILKQPIVEEEKKKINDKNDSHTLVKPKPSIKPIEKKSSKKHTPHKTSFYSLLHNNLFSDALALYNDAKEKDIVFYRATIEKYFQDKIKENPEESSIQMIDYLDIEPDNKTIKLLLSDAYKKSGSYQKAIFIISELLDNSSSSEMETLQNNLIATTKSYIKLLKESNSTQEITTFLNEHIDYGLNTPFFSMTLAKEYIALKKYDLATKILKDIEFDEKYGEEAKILLHEIENGTMNTSEYSYKLPLNKIGEHFTIDVIAEDTTLTLLLDTGATLTMINEDKVSSLALLNDNLILKTAGGEIHAELHLSETFKVGEIELKKFKIATSSFKQENSDGLLGMNFFKLFKFKIDQDEEVLYLSKK